MQYIFAIAPIKDYAFDVLVCAVIGVLVLLIGAAIFKRTWISIFIIGLLITISSIPVAIMSEVSISGCCGAPSNDHEGLGYIIGGVVALLGIGILVFSKHLVKKESSK